MRNLAIIPARGGSKRIPGKNILDFLGKPIIAYSIQAALESKLFDEVMVSTDDPGIAEIAISYGAKVPFLRSSKNSDDHATLADVLIEVTNEYRKTGKEFDALCCLLPTAPLTGSTRIIEAFQKMVTSNFDSVCPVVSFSYPILRSLEITDEGKLKMIWPEHERTRSQDLMPAYHDSGLFIWVKTEAIMKEKTLWCKNGGAIILPETEVQDIDSEEDWKLAEMKYGLLYDHREHRVLHRETQRKDYKEIFTFEQIDHLDLEIGNYQLTPLREQDIFNIKDWRNAQIDVMRQNHELTNEEQLRYFHEVIKPTFRESNPQQMLFSFLLNKVCIGYGGLTNIDWESKRGELSFLLNPIRVADPLVYEKEFSIFLDLMKQLAFEGLQFNRIFTETYDIRPLHISILEKNGFTPEGRLREHVLINGKFVDSLLHGFIKENYVAK